MEVTECHQKSFRSDWVLMTIPMTQRVPFFTSSMTVDSQSARFCMKTEETFRRETTETKNVLFFRQDGANPCDTYSLIQANTVPQ